MRDIKKKSIDHFLKVEVALSENTILLVTIATATLEMRQMTPNVHKVCNIYGRGQRKEVSNRSNWVTKIERRKTAKITVKKTFQVIYLLWMTLGKPHKSDFLDLPITLSDMDQIMTESLIVMCQDVRCLK